MILLESMSEVIWEPLSTTPFCTVVVLFPCGVGDHFGLFSIGCVAISARVGHFEKCSLSELIVRKRWVKECGMDMVRRTILSDQ
jgi:hypothetical protein